MTWHCNQCPAPLDSTDAALAHHDATGHHVNAPLPSAREALIGALEVLTDVVTQLDVWADRLDGEEWRTTEEMRDSAADLRNRCAAIRTYLERTGGGM